jgi:hypothetical protein
VSNGSIIPSSPARPDQDIGDVLDLIAALNTVALAALVHSGRDGIPRILLTLGFAVFVPGRAIVTNWPRMSRWSEAAITVTLSLAVLALAAMVSLWAHLWHPIGLFYGEAALCLAGLIAGQIRRRWLTKPPVESPAPPAVWAAGGHGAEADD